jgi:TPR repeat protein
MNNYGSGFENCFLGQIDLKEAMKYYKMLSDHGDLDGKKNYKRLLSQLEFENFI